MSQFRNWWKQQVATRVGDAWWALSRVCPGYPAFVMSDANQRKEAFIRFVFVVLFSVSPMVLIVFLDAISRTNLDWSASLRKYTDAGQIYFYVGTILGAAFILVRDNFREDFRQQPGHEMTGGERRMRTERTWFMGYLYVASVASVLILSVHHLLEKNDDQLIYWSSAFIYIVSLYVWFIDILYSQVGVDSGEAGGPSPRDEPPEPEPPDEVLAKVQKELAGMGQR